MKTSYLLVALALASISNLSANASLLYSDGFNYTDGDQVGTGSTTPPWTGTPSANDVITNVNLTYTGLQDLGGNSLALYGAAAQGAPESAALSTAQTSGSVYYSFLVDCTSLPTSNTYLTALTTAVKPGPNGSGTDAIDFYAKNSGAGWVLGERTTGTSAGYEGTVLALNTTYMVVLEYTFGGTAQLFFNPDPTAAQPGTATIIQTPTSYVTDVSDVGFKAQTPATTGNYIFDDLRVGTTWADVTSPTATPEPGTMALAGLGTLGLFFARRLRR